MASAMPTPSPLDEDPAVYLAMPRFNQTLDFDFESRSSRASYAFTDAPEDRNTSWPVLVFFNGLAGHRIIAALIEPIARKYDVQILTVDKPGCGSSSPVPLAQRTRWMHAALLAVLAHHNITEFAVLSHSNGLFYALYTLLHLPPHLSVTSWTLSGPFMPPSISRSTALRAAALLPNAIPNSLGTLLQVVLPVARLAGWSGGLLAASAGLLSSSASGGTVAEREARKPPHEREWVVALVGDTCRAAVMREGLAGAKGAVGPEALFSLHGGDAVPAPTPDGEADCVWGLCAGASDAEILRNAFRRLARRFPPHILRIRVVYGAADGIVPKQGRLWLRGVLEDVGLIRGGAGGVHRERVDEEEELTGEGKTWTEVPGAPHDGVLFREEVTARILWGVGEHAEWGRPRALGS
ncbi:Alpha/Beta hydrolase protein [Mycena capillaripes]|nr:Alpha/Beta hydrolase protein [Mycena capillaripes]KAJ6561607.1 Alpha/Beta hydrolase protein [Mycena capillaripes]